MKVLSDYILEKPLDLEELSVRINELAVKVLSEREVQAENLRITDIYRLLSEDDL